MKSFLQLILLPLVVFSSFAYADTATVSKGWNLMGINSNLTLQELGEGEILDIRGDNLAQSSINDFESLNLKDGYFLKSINQKNIDYQADTYENKSIELEEGWNLINPISNLTLDEIKNQVETDNLEEINGAESIYKKNNLQNLNNFKQFQEPLGYWIKVNKYTDLNFGEGSREYGKPNANVVKVEIYDENTSVYYPENRSSENKTPVILFVPGWSFGTQTHKDYETLLTFIASKGYTVFYAETTNKYTGKDFIERFKAIFEFEKDKNIDTTKLGIVGYSYGGGLSYSIFKHFVIGEKKWGENGKFIFTIAPWFAFDMSEDDFKSIPKDTKVVNVDFNEDNSTDHRITLTLYNKLTSIGNKNKDFQVYDTNDHGYPMGKNVNEMQGILKPLDALLDYALHQKHDAYETALGVGVDDPKMSLFNVDINIYSFSCKKSEYQEHYIDYCAFPID